MSLTYFDFVLQCRDRNVSKTSSDMLTLLSDHVDKFLDFHPDLPKRIVHVNIHHVCHHCLQFDYFFCNEI